jgi:5-methylcytosine-specific restriction protein B
MRSVHRLLSSWNFEFGHRVFFEAIRFAAILAASGERSWKVALDRQVMQKVLPRLHGSRRRLEAPLTALGRFCFDFQAEPPAATAGFDPLLPGDGTPQLPLSFEKVQRMVTSLRANQFASFAE